MLPPLSMPKKRFNLKLDYWTVCSSFIIMVYLLQERL